MDDLNHVKAIIAFLGVDHCFQKLVNLGGKAEKPRPLRVVANDPEVVTKILKAATKMANMKNMKLIKMLVYREIRFLERGQNRGLFKERKR